MTYSIVARDPVTGAVGVATATAGPAVGSLVPHARAGVGAVATQAMTNPYLAFDSLRLLPGRGASEALEQVLARDEDREQRQVIIIDRHGESAGWTGGSCEAYAGHLTHPDVAIAGNIIAGPHVLAAMMKAYNGQEGPLEDRLMRTLAAGEGAGGDTRGTGSAALKIFTTEEYPAVDLRVDMSKSAIADLSQLLDTAVRGSYADFLGKITRRHGGE
jgi:uncharacterized Ntn-hydrolase superfamily protein